MKFKILIMIAAVCFAIIPMVAYTILTNTMVKGDGGKMFEKEISEIGQAQINNLQALLDKTHSDINVLANTAGVKEFASSGSTDSAGDAIKRFVDDNDVIIGAMIVDTAGKIVVGTSGGSSIGGSLDSYADYGDYANNELFFTKSGSQPIEGVSDSMFIKTNVGKGQLFIFYVMSEETSLLSRFIRATNFYGGEGKIAIFDSKGEWSYTGARVSGDAEKTYTSTVVDKFAAVADGTTSELFHFDYSGKDNLAVLTKVGGDNGLYALTHCPANKSGYYSGKLATPIISITIVVGILGLVAAIVVSKNITNPLTKIQEALDKIIRGDHEVRISNMTNNEYGQMSRAFNNVVDQIVVSEDRYKVISDMSDNIIFEWNFKTMEVIFSNNFNKKFSFRPQSDHFGDSFLMKAKLHPDDAEKYKTDIGGLEKGKNLENNEYRIKNIYGDFIWILIRTATLNDAEGNPLKAVGVMVDIDRAKKSEAKLTEQASYDALTELYNRETIESQIDNEISLSGMRKSEMAVMFIDVDDFKHYNDNYSHATGDQVLKFLAKTIKETVDGIGIAGRYGGDEFVAMIRNAENNDPATIAATIIERLAAGFDADVGDHLSVSVSIGIAVIRDDYNTRVEYLIGKADDAMYSVKKSGKSNYAFI